MFNMEEFNKDWEKNVRDMGAASFFGLDENPIDFDSEDIIDVEYKEV